MNNSFYGGKRGASFIIARNFSSVTEMEADFKLGNKSSVNYDEYVLIDAKDSQGIDNGKIFQRGHNYFDEHGGALYKGKISGPPGPAPNINLATIEQVNDKAAQEGLTPTTGEYITPKDLVPGKEGDIYTDNIQWAYCTVNDELNKKVTMYLGFKVPYTVIDYTATPIGAYFDPTQNLAKREDTGEHPFYEKWNISVPKGIKGDAFKNLRVMEATDIIQDYEGKQDDIDNKRKVLVYDYYNYDVEETPTPTSIFLGDFNKIDDILIDEEGTITFQYSHDDDKAFNKKFKWIKNISLDSTNGHFTVTYNQDIDTQGNPTIYETDLKWVNDLVVSEDGTITLKFINGEETPLTNKIKWITKTELAVDGTFTVTYNDATTDIFSKQIQWITNISLTEQGVFTVKYNNGEPDYSTTLVWPTNFQIAQDGTITVTFNTGKIDTYDKFLKIISDISINTGAEEGTGSQKVNVVYNTGEQNEIGEPLNYVMKTAVSEDYHLLFLHSDPAKRAEIKAAGKNYRFDGRDDWEDMGSIKNNDGILIGKYFDVALYPEFQLAKTAIEYLNTNYPNGFTEPDLIGKIASSGGKDENKSFYAFDYSKENGVYKGWYFLGTFGDQENLSLVVGRKDNQTVVEQAAKLPPGSVWFVVKENPNEQ